MLLVAREGCRGYLEDRVSIFNGGIFEAADEQADDLIREGKAYKYSFDGGIDYDYDPDAEIALCEADTYKLYDGDEMTLYNGTGVSNANGIWEDFERDFVLLPAEYGSTAYALTATAESSNPSLISVTPTTFGIYNYPSFKIQTPHNYVSPSNVYIDFHTDGVDETIRFYF